MVEGRVLVSLRIVWNGFASDITYVDLVIHLAFPIISCRQTVPLPFPQSVAFYCTNSFSCSFKFLGVMCVVPNFNQIFTVLKNIVLRL